jgi:hypothetical protein
VDNANPAILDGEAATMLCVRRCRNRAANGAVPAVASGRRTLIPHRGRRTEGKGAAPAACAHPVTGHGWLILNERASIRVPAVRETHEF